MTVGVLVNLGIQGEHWPRSGNVFIVLIHYFEDRKTATLSCNVYFSGVFGYLENYNDTHKDAKIMRNVNEVLCFLFNERR